MQSSDVRMVSAQSLSNAMKKLCQNSNRPCCSDEHAIVLQRGWHHPGKFKFGLKWTRYIETLPGGCIYIHTLFQEEAPSSKARVSRFIKSKHATSKTLSENKLHCCGLLRVAHKRLPIKTDAAGFARLQVLCLPSMPVTLVQIAALQNEISPCS